MSDITTHIDYYNNQIYGLIKNIDLDQSDNYVLSKPFEYYWCILLTTQENKIFYSYNLLLPSIKEQYDLSRRDLGVDSTDLTNTLVQVKMYSKTSTITFTELAKTMAWRDSIDENGNLYVKWPNVYLCRLTESLISDNLNVFIKRRVLKDKHISRELFINGLKDILSNTKDNIINEPDIKLRDYQNQCIDLIEQSDIEKKNVIISLATGLGKTIISVFYMMKYPNKHFLVFVPTLTLLEHWYEFASKYIKNIHRIGTGYNNTIENPSKYNLVICVYNSCEVVAELVFDKIIIDEAHHIKTPQIYDDYDNDEDDEKENKYTDIMSSMLLNNNCVLQSATIDKNDDCLYFGYSIREGIEKGYLVDYQICIPIFTKTPDNLNIGQYLIDEGLNYCIIFAANIEEGKRFNKLLNTIIPNCSAYLDCYTSKSDRNMILKNFKNENIRFLINIRILTEGFDASIATNCVFLHYSTSEQFIIQAIGRVLRPHANKKFARIVLPATDKEDSKYVQKFIRTLAENDGKIKEAYNKKQTGYIDINIVTGRKENTEDSDEEDNREDTIEFKEAEFLYNEIYNSLGTNISAKTRAEMLLQFVNENNRVPKQQEEYKGVMIGRFWNHIKQGQNKAILPDLLKNKILKQEYDRYIKLKEEQLTPDEKKDLLLEFVNDNNIVPKCREEYKEIKIGKFWDSFKQGHNKAILPDLLKNKILKQDYDKYLKSKEEKGEKKQLTPDEKKGLLLQFVNDNNRVPKCKEEYNGLKIGKFWSGIKQGQNKALLPDLLKNKILKQDYDKYLKSKEKKEKKGEKEEKEEKEQLTPDEKKDLLLQFVNDNNRVSKRSDEYKGVKLGQFWNSIKQGHNKAILPDLLKNKFLKQDYDKYLKSKEKQLTPNKKKELLLQFVNDNNRVPKYKEEYNGLKIAQFWDSIKRGINKALLPDLLKNKILNDNYNKTINN